MESATGRTVCGHGESADQAQHGAVLVVEDEDHLRHAVVKILRKSGFQVFDAGDGYAAIDLLRARGSEIDVILLDMTIPGASSQEIVAEAASRPDIKVVLTSAKTARCWPALSIRRKSAALSASRFSLGIC